MLRKRGVTKRERFLFSILLLVFLAVLVKKGGERLRINVNRLDEAISINEKELAKLKGVLKQAGTINSEYDEAFSGYKGLSGSDNLLQELGRIARNSNLNMLSMKPALAEDAKKYRIYVIKIESQDDLSDLAGFLYNLTEGLKGIGLERLQIKAQARDELPWISMTLSAAIFKD